MLSDLFLLPFMSALALGAGLSVILLCIPFLRRRLWRSGARHLGKASLPRLGGVTMMIAFVGTMLLDSHLVLSREIIGLGVALVCACIFGLWDDFRELSAKAQAFLQVVLAVILFVFGMRITTLRNPFGETFIFSEQGIFSIFFGFMLLLLWLILVINAVNWLDGLDGLLGSISFITFVVIFFLSLKPEVNQPPVAILAVIGAGSVLGFLLFNMHPAKLLAGTSGSLFLGTAIAALAVIAGTKIATALLVLALPVMDALFVMGERLYFKQSIFRSDKRHLHYKLRELGWSEGAIAWFFFLFTALVGYLSIKTEALEKFLVMLLVFIFLFLFLVTIASLLYKRKQTH